MTTPASHKRAETAATTEVLATLTSVIEGNFGLGPRIDLRSGATVRDILPPLSRVHRPATANLRTAPNVDESPALR
jgi:hypothetical protein